MFPSTLRSAVTVTAVAAASQYKSEVTHDLTGSTNLLNLFTGLRKIVYMFYQFIIKGYDSEYRWTLVPALASLRGLSILQTEGKGKEQFQKPE